MTYLSPSPRLLQTIHRRHSDGRVFALTDLHGEYEKVRSALKYVGFDFERDLLVLGGDLCDRGPESVACLRLLLEPWVTAIMGNHEQFMLDALNENGLVCSASGYYLWHANGGEWSARLYPAALADLRRLLITLPLGLEYRRRDGQIVGLCHAEVPELSWKNVRCLQTSELDTETLTWLSDHMLWSRRYAPSYNKLPIDEPVRDIDMVIHGHTIQPDGPQWVANRLYYDIGATLDPYEPLCILDLDAITPGETPV